MTSRHWGLKCSKLKVKSRRPSALFFKKNRIPQAFQTMSRHSERTFGLITSVVIHIYGSSPISVGELG